MSVMTASPPARMLGPDFARGFALLGIAIANSIVVWSKPAQVPDNAVSTTIGLIVDNSVWDKLAVVMGAMFIHVRGLPMFATLLGYGIGMIYVREQRKGATGSQSQQVLLRRYSFLALFGLAHTIVLFWGDIMLTYGLLALCVIALVKLNDKKLLTIAACLYSFSAIVTFGILFFTPMMAMGGQNGNESYLRDQLVTGLLVAIFVPVQLLISGGVVMALIIVGFVAGRREVFQHPEQYSKQLRIAMAVTAVVILCVGVPHGLAAIGVIGNEDLFHALNNSIGFASGPGLVAVMFWLAHRIEIRGFAGLLPVRMIAALGRMSMTGYVLQSVLFGIFVAGYGLGIGSGAGAAAVSVVATCVWFATVIFAYVWLLRSKSGPLELAHRRLAYKRPPALAPPRQVPHQPQIGLQPEQDKPLQQ